LNAIGVPEVRLVLPGSWMKVLLHDAEQVEALLQVAADAVPDADMDELRTNLLLATAAGGDMVLLRTDTDEPAMIMTAWPPAPGETVPGLDALRARLGAEVADQCTVLDHVGGFAVLRRRTDDGVLGPVQLTYWIAHPVSGRVLSMDVALFSATELERQTRHYDLLAANVGWDERVTLDES
jgi:hypothetical protein